MSKGLSSALAVEYEAIYALGAAGAQLNSDQLDFVLAANEEHRDRRDAAVARLKKSDADVPKPEPAYQLSVEVSDAASARELVSKMEDRVCQAWRAAVGETGGADREKAVEAYLSSAVTIARWRRLVDETPTVEAFPGRPQ